MGVRVPPPAHYYNGVILSKIKGLDALIILESIGIVTKLSK
ncbi:MAG: hypothetical protein ACFFFT_05435 [Candidatus Thorarchaeota archaeon]